MEVTALRANPRVPERISVEVDGARFGVLPLERVNRLGLRAGLVLEGEQRRRFEWAVEVQRTYDRAVRMLASRPRSINDLIRRLRAKGFDPSACAAAVGRLEDSHVLDDRRFASHYALGRLTRGFGRSRILSDLIGQGVERCVAAVEIDRVMLAEEIDQMADARRLAAQRIGRARDLPDDKVKARVLAYLARRGHSGWEVREMVDGLIGDRAQS